MKQNKPRTKQFYLDADSLIYVSVYKSETEAEVKRRINKNIMTIAEVMGAIAQHYGYPDTLRCTLAVKGKDNFRHKISPIYKANRKKKDMTHLEAQLMETAHLHLVEHWNAVEAHGMEADDLVVMWNHEEPGIIVGIDKDLLQSPGLHYNPTKNKLIEVSEEESKYLLHTQLLTGDSADNIKGLYNVGPKKAEAFLKGVPANKQLAKVRDIWKQEHGKGWEAELQLTADLVYLRRSVDDRYDTTL